MDARSWSDADNAKVIVKRADRAGHMGAVIMVVVASGLTGPTKGPARRAVHTADHVQVGMLEVHTSVDHGHIDVDTRVDRALAAHSVLGS